MLNLSTDRCFHAPIGAVEYYGEISHDAAEFSDALRTTIANRAKDKAQADDFQADMAALATTQMATDTLTRLLSEQTRTNAWEYGEALAECILEKEGACFPWNMDKDKRTPNASLPGADIVGFKLVNGENFLLIGEVKTSSDLDSPPQVLYGRSGMIHQLDKLASQLRLHRCLLNWLHARCKNHSSWPKFKEAATKYLASEGKEIYMCGFLLRDTNPTQSDLHSRANKLAEKISSPTLAVLRAIYTPIAIDQWQNIIEASE